MENEAQAHRNITQSNLAGSPQRPVPTRDVGPLQQRVDHYGQMLGRRRVSIEILENVCSALTGGCPPPPKPLADNVDQSDSVNGRLLQQNDELLAQTDRLEQLVHYLREQF